MRTAHVCAVGIGVAVLVGCASKPLDTASLDQARTEVQTFANNPAASELANREFSAARNSLASAEDALKAKNQEDVDYYSYLAVRQARTGEARIAENKARQQLALGKGERERLILEARNKELEAKSKLAAQQTERGMVLTLSGVLFETGKTTLKPGATPTLDRVASYMAQFPKTLLIVEGHTDSTGSRETNQELSALRAQAVADALVARGVPRDRIDMVGRGPDMPVASNSTPEGRQQNRRVEMVFSDGSGRFAEGARGAIR